MKGVCKDLEKELSSQSVIAAIEAMAGTIAAVLMEMCAKTQDLKSATDELCPRSEAQDIAKEAGKALVASTESVMNSIDKKVEGKIAVVLDAGTVSYTHLTLPTKA